MIWMDTRRCPIDRPGRHGPPIPARGQSGTRAPPRPRPGGAAPTPPSSASPATAPPPPPSSAPLPVHEYIHTLEYPNSRVAARGNRVIMEGFCEMFSQEVLLPALAGAAGNVAP